MVISKKTNIKDLTIEELQALISGIVKKTLEDTVEDLQALSSSNYIKSIQTARKEYKVGKVKSIEDLFDG